MKMKWYVPIAAIGSVVVILIGVERWKSDFGAQNILYGAAESDGGGTIDAEYSNNVSDTADSYASSVPEGTAEVSKKENASPKKILATAPDTVSEKKTEMGDAVADRVDVLTKKDAASPDVPPQSITAGVQAVHPSCAFPSTVSSTTKKAIFNEIAWMGSPSSSGAEWIELKNISGDAIALSGWHIEDASQKLSVTLSGGDAIPAGGFFMLSRGSGTGKIYAGDLVNGGDTLALIDSECMVSDYLDASHGWPAGNNMTKQTLERDDDHIGWHTSASSGGTPDAENSAGPPPAQFSLSIGFEGAGGDSITSDPAGLVCVASCSGTYASGTRVTLTPVPGTNAAFDSWSGLCYGQTVCSFVISGDVSLSANFHSTLVVPTATADADIVEASGTEATIPNVTAPGHVLVAAIQIAGASSSNDFVKLINPTAATVDISGWKLRKRSQTGTDYSLKTFSAGSSIAPGGSFVWANSAGGFSASIGADASSTETLSADNSIALMDASGTVIDAVAWGTGNAQYGTGSPYPTDPAPGQVLSRREANGIPVDTGDNANDFTLSSS